MKRERKALQGSRSYSRAHIAYPSQAQTSHPLLRALFQQEEGQGRNALETSLLIFKRHTSSLFLTEYARTGSIFTRRLTFSADDCGEVPIPQLFKVDPWIVIIPVAFLIVGLLFLIDKSGS